MSIQLQFLPAAPASSSRTTAMLRFQGSLTSSSSASAAGTAAVRPTFIVVGRDSNAAEYANNIGGVGGGRGNLQIVGRDVCLGQATRASTPNAQFVQRSFPFKSRQHQILNLGDIGNDDYYNIDAAREAEASLESQFLPDNGLYYDFETLSSPGFSDDGDELHQLLHPATPVSPTTPVSASAASSFYDPSPLPAIDGGFHYDDADSFAKEAGPSPVGSVESASLGGGVTPAYDGDDEHMYDVSLIATPTESVGSVESVEKAANEPLPDVEAAPLSLLGQNIEDHLPDLSSDEIASFLNLLKSQSPEADEAPQMGVGENVLSFVAESAVAGATEFDSIPVLAEEDFFASAQFSEMKPLQVQFSPPSSNSDPLSMAIAAADLGDGDMAEQTPVEPASINPAAVGTIDIRTWFDIKEAHDAQDPVYNSVQIVVSSPSPAANEEAAIFTPGAAASEDAGFSASGYSTDDYTSSYSSSVSSSIMSPAGFSSCSGTSPAPSTMASAPVDKKKKARSPRKSKATGAKRGRKPSLVPKGSDPVKKEKKKQQNKDAAKRYREKKRIEEAENLIIVKELQKRNKDLKKQFRALFARFEGAKFLAEAAYGK